MTIKGMKYDLAKAVHELVKEDMTRSRLRTEVTKITDLQTQVKVWPDEGTPRYFVIQVKEV